ncbi:sigma 54-interacting transcriptional regulator [Desulfuromonas sp. KJ2020]|uniref:sigma-54 interaction domain-containing protein n=1 Tax=Desulfuromonas sp. KJ2020 TaxID=2919173 RepID=UPI0020A733DF|nr:sigma 54-interacting transcriptional regulator [Desulfuromonas sp. KJ2020]MCP3175747.1 sigma 54-interacting transcriptional regulator [Desulfuromonas sp. KJ2020]
MLADGEKSIGLPARVPDLVAARGEVGPWRVLSLSPALAEWLGVASTEAVGAPLEELFAGVRPALPDLANEAIERDLPLLDLQIRFAGREDILLMVEVRPGGLTSDFRGRTVTFTFRQPTSAERDTVETFHGMVGSSPLTREVFRKISLYGPTTASVVVTGETGSGKELVARALHDCSDRDAGPYVAVNCSAISAELLESELFGHEKGAFTGAVRTHVGRFERADGGTLFLDEIGDMPLHTQAKLLRVLEEGTFERVGGESTRRIDVRIVAATNVPLEQAVGQGRFRADLYHRLSVLRIHLPPLRERKEDIPALVTHFLRIFSQKYDRRIHRLTGEALALLQSYLWPGNVRELRNVLERVFIETQGEVIGAKAFREWIQERRHFAAGEWGSTAAETPPLIPPYPLLSAPSLLEGQADISSSANSPRRQSTRPAELDADEIRRAFQAADGNLTAAARLLGVHRATLYRYLDKLDLSRRDLES